MAQIDPVNLSEFEKLAEAQLDPGAFGYIAGGADGEVTTSKLPTC